MRFSLEKGLRTPLEPFLRALRIQILGIGLLLILSVQWLGMSFGSVCVKASKFLEHTRTIAALIKIIHAQRYAMHPQHMSPQVS